VLATELGDMHDGLFGSLRQPYRFAFAEQAPQREEFGSPGQQATTIATAGTGAADVAFNDRNIQCRVLLFELQCGPQTGEAAADNGNVSLLCALQCRREFTVNRKSVFQPEWAHEKLS